jgi:subtilisin
MTNRRAGKFRDGEKIASRAAVGKALAAIAGGASILSDTNPEDPTARRVLVFDAEPTDVRVISPSPDVLLEPEILHWTHSFRPAEFARVSRSTLAGPLSGVANRQIDFMVRGNGRGLQGAAVHLFLRAPGNLTRERVGSTDENGVVQFIFPDPWIAAAAVVVPAGGFWTMVVRGPGSSVNVDCPQLEAAGPLGWWHHALGIHAFDPARGAGIRVGVIDTGVGPHPALAHVTRIGAFINGAELPGDAAADVDSHGSHVCGIIGARPQENGQYGGIAPGAELFCARVFADAESGANQGDIANAIDALSRTHAVDVINMSLGSDSPSQIEQDAIRDAVERGTLCLCAAGNSSGPVQFPGAFPESIAVSAVGLLGWGPAGSLASTRVPQDSEMLAHENLYLANFSCFGNEVATAGPGVGILSTVPGRFGMAAPYAAMDGTSMASPAAVGALAAILGATSSYADMPRDETRSQSAIGILRNSCRDLGLASVYEGRGILHIS